MPYAVNGIDVSEILRELSWSALPLFENGTAGPGSLKIKVVTAVESFALDYYAIIFGKSEKQDRILVLTRAIAFKWTFFKPIALDVFQDCGYDSLTIEKFISDEPVLLTSAYAKIQELLLLRHGIVSEALARIEKYQSRVEALVKLSTKES